MRELLALTMARSGRRDGIFDRRRAPERGYEVAEAKRSGAGAPPVRVRCILMWLVMAGGIVRLGRFVPPPDASLGGGDGAARHSYHLQPRDARGRDAVAPVGLVTAPIVGHTAHE